MSRVITFSRYFPKKHPRAGEPTHFIEKVLKSFIQNDNLQDDPTVYSEWWCELLGEKIATVGPLDVTKKYHTIRAGNRWKVGDTFSPRVWSGKPYASKQIQFAPDIEIKKIWNVAYHAQIFFLNEKIMSGEQVEQLSWNDGLNLEDFYAWFDIHPKAKKGITHFQILCWNDRVNY